MTTISHEGMVAQASSWVRRVQHELDTIYFVKAQCDEAALLFDTPADLDNFVMWALDTGGLERIGYVDRDVMRRASMDGSPPPNEAFDVRFDFWRVPGADWRIEAMCVLGGFAPLHTAALQMMGNGSVVHVSWRAAPNGDELGYHRHRKCLEDDTVAGSLTALAEYTNSYGRFCYYGEEGNVPYLKPRVNLRDN